MTHEREQSVIPGLYKKQELYSLSFKRSRTANVGSNFGQYSSESRYIVLTDAHLLRLKTALLFRATLQKVISNSIKATFSI